MELPLRLTLYGVRTREIGNFSSDAEADVGCRCDWPSRGPVKSGIRTRVDASICLGGWEKYRALDHCAKEHVPLAEAKFLTFVWRVMW